MALARLRLARGEWESAAEHIAAAEQLVAQTNVDGFVESWLLGIRLRLWLATDQLAAAVQWAEQHDLRPDGELSYYFDLHHIHLARLLLAQAEAKNDDSCLQSYRHLPDPLSEREQEVLRFLPTHLTSTEIAEALTVSANTVRTHIKNIYGKLGVRSRGEAVAPGPRVSTWGR